jgi:NitT/TauT family transport system substrate-binding protein
MSALLRINQSGAPVFYLPHLAAQSLGFFTDAGVSVEIVTSGHRRQWEMLTSGAADVTIGGPMRTMKLREEGKELVSFCAAVATTPWVLLGRESTKTFSWADLEGATVIDWGAVETPRLCLGSIMSRHGLTLGEHVSLIETTGPKEGLELFLERHGDFLLHPAETVLHLTKSNGTHIAAALASELGEIPWSTYAALPSTVERKGDALRRYVVALRRTFAWIRTAPPEDIASAVSDWHPETAIGDLAQIVEYYRRLGVWPTSPVIERAAIERYSHVLHLAGWLSAEARYEDQVVILE